jgi:UDP-N-acetylglucosamine 2-epimerase
MNHRKKLTSQQQTDEQLHAASQHEAQQQQTGHNFDSVEALLRHDALHTPMPPSVARRLQESIAQLPPPPPRSWWRRFLGG